MPDSRTNRLSQYHHINRPYRSLLVKYPRRESWGSSSVNNFVSLRPSSMLSSPTAASTKKGRRLVEDVLNHPVIIQMTLDGGKDIRVCLQGHGTDSCSTSPWNPSFRFEISSEELLPAFYMETRGYSYALNCYILSKRSYYYEYACLDWQGFVTKEGLLDLSTCHVDAIKRGLNLVQEELDRQDRESSSDLSDEG
jgi:hypothetical protein